MCYLITHHTLYIILEVSMASELDDGNIIFNSCKEYNDMIKIVIYNEPFRVKSGIGRKRSDNPKITRSSLLRTKQTLTDLCIQNNFDLFCTFTFDPKRFNSKSITFCRMYMRNWLRNSKDRHSPHLEYLIVPELHKSGAVHFHALFRGYEGKLKDSKHCSNGRRIYNLANWHFGFSTAVEIDNQEAVSRYIRKYITKDMILLPCQKRYWCSQGLSRPIKRQNISIDWLRSVKCDFFKSQDAEYYTIHKTDLPQNFNFDLPTSLEALRSLPLSGNVLL